MRRIGVFAINLLSRPGFAYISVFLVWLITLISRIMYNGLVFGLDYGLFHPDGSLYTFRALLFSGLDKSEAGSIVANWYDNHSYKAKYEGPEMYFENNKFLWDQYMTRLLYPLVSAPFVKVLGVPGMLVLPSLTYLVVLLVTTKIAIHKGIPVLGVVAAILITSSTSISRWMFANITDGLLLLFVSIFMLLISKDFSLNFGKGRTFALVLLICLSAITRFSAFFWFGVAIVFFLQNQRRIAVIAALTTVVAHIPIFLRPFGGHVLPGFGEKSVLEKLAIYPINMAKVTIFEIGQLVVLDRMLLLLLLFTLVWSARNYRLFESQLMLLCFIMLWLTGSINGVLGVNFRYQIPIVPIMLMVLVVAISQQSFLRSLSKRDTSQESTGS